MPASCSQVHLWAENVKTKVVVAENHRLPGGRLSMAVSPGFAVRVLSRYLLLLWLPIPFTSAAVPFRF